MACCCAIEDPPTRPPNATVSVCDSQISLPSATVQLTPPLTELSFSRKPLPPGCRRFTYRELQGATGDFAENAVLGEGGFGRVFRGTLEDGTPVAIKCLDRLGLQGDKEFNVEVSTLGVLRHSSLVTLLGVCTEARHRLAVFDFMPGGSLRDNLDRKATSQACQAPRAHLLWPARIGIAMGAARGLAYLHEGARPGLIHRDVKSSNVLLDSLGHARMADFGLALHTGTCSGPSAYSFQTQPSTDTEMLTGTFGYSAPEYIRHGRMSQKSDVYSFGVILLELLTGSEPVDASRPASCQVLVDALLPILRNGDIQALQDNLDPVMPTASVPVPQLAAFSEVALACLQTNPDVRPRMAEVVKFLEAIVGWKDTLPELRSTSGRFTLSNLMDAVALVPPLGPSDEVLTPLPWSPAPEASSQVHPERFQESCTLKGHSSAPLQAGRTPICPHCNQAAESPSLPSRGSESWPSMPIASGEMLQGNAVAQHEQKTRSKAQNHLPFRGDEQSPHHSPGEACALQDRGHTQPIAGLSNAPSTAYGISALHCGCVDMAAAGPSTSRGDASQRSDVGPPYPKAGRHPTEAPVSPSNRGSGQEWVVFDQNGTFSTGRAVGRFASEQQQWSTPVGDPAHFWSMPAPQVVLTPRRPPPPPPKLGAALG